MIDHNGAWLPTVWGWLPIIIIAFLAMLTLSIWIVRNVEDGNIFVWLMTGPTALLLAVIPWFTYWPYDGDYHRLQPAIGVVKEIDSRFLAASQYVVVTYDTGLIVRCDDSRCATVKPGDSLRLLCTKEFEWGAVNGWGCRWGQA